MWIAVAQCKGWVVANRIKVLCHSSVSIWNECSPSLSESDVSKKSILDGRYGRQPKPTVIDGLWMSPPEVCFFSLICVVWLFVWGVGGCVMCLRENVSERIICRCSIWLWLNVSIQHFLLCLVVLFSFLAMSISCSEGVTLVTRYNVECVCVWFHRAQWSFSHSTSAYTHPIPAEPPSFFDMCGCIHVCFLVYERARLPHNSNPNQIPKYTTKIVTVLLVLTQHKLSLLTEVLLMIPWAQINKSDPACGSWVYGPLPSQISHHLWFTGIYILYILGLLLSSFLWMQPIPTPAS